MDVVITFYSNRLKVNPV